MASSSLSSAVLDPNTTALIDNTTADLHDLGYNDMSSIDFGLFAYSLNKTQTGCFRPGALPISLAFNDTCLPGFHCPYSTDDHPPQFCPPDEKCQITRAMKGTCDPQGYLEPKICDNGFYCPAGGKEMIKCPKGTFCPSGSRRLFVCSYASICPAGSERQIVVLPLYLTMILDAILLILAAAGFIFAKRRKRLTEYTAISGVDGVCDVESLRKARDSGRSRFLRDMPSIQHRASPSPSPSRSPSISRSPSPSSLPHTASTHVRRASGRVDHYDGFFDHDTDTLIDDDCQDDLLTSPDMQRFIESMSKAVETTSIGLKFDYQDLSYETKGGKRILSGVSGTMPRGSCWGIMGGGSGAGKSTFVNVLMGKIRAKEGFIKINGHVQDMARYKKLIGHVPQDDIVFPELTVRENILHSARVRLSANWSDREIEAHVDTLVACLQLSHVQHSRVGDAARPVISGGQRKRVNIAMELASAPMAIFLDEPTSGLDAASAASIMRLLRAISRLGVTTIAIIHQPREQIFYGFDQLLLLAQGCAVYSGLTQDCQAYFEQLGFVFPERGNPADVLIDIATGDGSQYAAPGKRYIATVSALIEHWKIQDQSAVDDTHGSLDGAGTPSTRSRRISAQSVASTEEQEESLRLTMGARGATWPAQVYYCLIRALTQQVRNSTSFFYEIGVGALAGGIIGLSAYASGGHLFQGIYHPPFTILSSAVDYQSTPQLGLLGGMAIGLAASAPGFWVFGEEKIMFWRETAAGHSRSAYYLGKMLSTLPRIALTSLHFTVFMGILATPLISFTDMWMANLMYFWCIYGLAGIISMLVKREDGPLVAVLASLVVGMLSGVAPPLKQANAWHME